MGSSGACSGFHPKNLAGRGIWSGSEQSCKSEVCNGLNDDCNEDENDGSDEQLAVNVGARLFGNLAAAIKARDDLVNDIETGMLGPREIVVRLTEMFREPVERKLRRE